MGFVTLTSTVANPSPSAQSTGIAAWANN